MSRTRAWLAAAAATTAVGAASIGGVLAVTGASAATGSSASVGSAAGRGTSACRDVDVHVSYRGGDAAMSHRYGRIVVENTSTHACSTQGYGGLSYVGGGDGTQVGAAADRTPSPTPRTVLKPGDRVASVTSEAEAAAYPVSSCSPVHVDGFRVYLPGETHSSYVAHPTTGCRNGDVQLLDHKAFR